MIDVVVLGAGIAGLTAAYELRDLDIEVVEAEPEVGGRMKSATLASGRWVNYGAQYASHDKAWLIALADELGVAGERMPVGRHRTDPIGTYARFLGLEYEFTDAERAEIADVMTRIDAEAADARPLDDPTVDGVSLHRWLGDVSLHVRLFFELLTTASTNASAFDVSLLGFLQAWGDQRTSPWSGPEHWRSAGEHVVFAGGTSRLTAALADRLDGRVSVGTRVDRLVSVDDHVLVEVVEPAGQRRTIEARVAVCALPAPIAASVIDELPQWKRDALGRVRYGRFVSTPISVAPVGQPVMAVPEADVRIEPPYARLYGRPWRLSPWDADERGAIVPCIAYEPGASVIWHDDDDSIRAGVHRHFARVFPEWVDRVEFIGVERWELGLPMLTTGMMRHRDGLAASVGPIHFCGDYSAGGLAHMEAAGRTGHRAAEAVRKAAL